MAEITTVNVRTGADFVRLVYANVVGSAPGPQEFDLYKGLLDSGAYSQAGLALLACDTELNKLGIDLVGLAATGLPYLPA